MIWQVLIHPLVFQEDLGKLDGSAQQKIIKNIRKKLTSDPRAYGKPLSGELHGYWKLKIGEYRVIYRIEEAQVVVKVIKAGIRRDFSVYEELIRRIPKILNF